jgi:hypothetical protein
VLLVGQLQSVDLEHRRIVLASLDLLVAEHVRLEGLAIGALIQVEYKPGPDGGFVVDLRLLGTTHPGAAAS